MTDACFYIYNKMKNNKLNENQKLEYYYIFSLGEKYEKTCGNSRRGSIRINRGV